MKKNPTSIIFILTWLLTLLLIVLFIGFMFGAHTYRHIQNGGEKISNSLIPYIEKIANLPSLVMQAGVEFIGISPLLIHKTSSMQTNWTHKFPAPDDNGYLLLSGFDPDKGQSTVKLIRIADGHILAHWIPDWNYIHQKTSHHRFSHKGSPNNYRAFHPLLLYDGSIIFNSGSNLVRLPLCSNKPEWIIDYPFHHSIELSDNENSVWVPSVTDKFTINRPDLQNKIRDDSLSEVSLNGEIIKNISFSKTLVDNNLKALLLGNTGFTLNDDPIHLNQITPALKNTKYWNRGDLLISARHLSSIFLYRPSTHKVLWHQQGPWLNQHSVHFIDDNRIAIFGNDVVYSGRTANASKLSSFENSEEQNFIYIHDFSTSQTHKTNYQALTREKPRSFTEGRVRVLKDNSLIIEDTNNSRIFKIASNGILQWSYLNSYKEDYLGVISWSRYLISDEIKNISVFFNSENLNCTKK